MGCADSGPPAPWHEAEYPVLLLLGPDAALAQPVE
jgi:hypothetical protein